MREEKSGEKKRFQLTEDFLRKFAESNEVDIEVYGVFPEIKHLAPIKTHVNIPNKMTYLSDSKFIDTLQEDKGVVAVMTIPELYEKFSKILSSYFTVVIDDIQLFWKLHNTLGLQTNFYEKEIEKNKSVQERCNIASSAKIHPTVVMGKDCNISENVVIKKNVILNDNVSIGGGTLIGEDSLEIYEIDGVLTPIYHDGRVIINANVKIGANCTINQGIYGLDTVLGRETKVDDHVHIAHGVQIGNRVIITSGVIFGGSCIVEDNVFIGLGAVVKNGIIIGKNSFISMGAIVTKDIPANAKVVGFPSRLVPYK